MPEYQVKYFVTGAFDMFVRANSIEEAREKAKARLKRKGIFHPDYNALDWYEEFMGIDNMNLWSKLHP